MGPKLEKHRWHKWQDQKREEDKRAKNVQQQTLPSLSITAIVLGKAVHTTASKGPTKDTKRWKGCLDCKQASIECRAGSKGWSMCSAPTTAGDARKALAHAVGEGTSTSRASQSICGISISKAGGVKEGACQQRSPWDREGASSAWSSGTWWTSWCSEGASKSSGTSSASAWAACQVTEAMGRATAMKDSNIISTLAARPWKNWIRNPVRRKVLTSMVPMTLRKSGMPKAVALSTVLDSTLVPETLAGPLATSMVQERSPLAHAHPSNKRSAHMTFVLIGTKLHGWTRYSGVRVAVGGLTCASWKTRASMSSPW